MVDVAQLVRAPGCGPGGRGFESHLSPHFLSILSVVKHMNLFERIELQVQYAEILLELNIGL